MSLQTNLLRAAAGLFVGLLLTELAFSWRDDGAFPHVNVYMEDDALGVRLAPGTSQRISFGGNPTTSFSINALGYRSPEWPEPSAGDVLVVGDSQVFGLGVEVENTTPSQLGGLLGRPVLNGGVPTYGPDEYLSVVEEVAASRSLDTVVVVFNFANDLFEVGRPNTERHAVWDGWAVRTETAPDSVTYFPGRSWLYGRSHAFFALRRALHQPSAQASAGFASEGSIRDVLVATETSRQKGEEQEQVLQQKQQKQNEAYQEALNTLQAPNPTLVELFSRTHHEDDHDLKLQAAVNKRSPGDIVYPNYAESSRRITVTAEMLQEGAQIRRTLKSRLRTYAEENPDSHLTADILDALGTASGVDDAVTIDEATVAWQTPLDAALDRLDVLASTYGFKPVVVALPLDLQVSPSQFEKYGAEPKEMAESQRLLNDLAVAARRRGMRVVEPLGALAAAGDDAFLDRDLHLSATGHAVVAAEIAAALAAPAPSPPPASGISDGRSRVPWSREWAAQPESIVRGSSKNRCETRQIREWFRMDCQVPVEGLRIVDAPLETHGWYDGHRLMLSGPLLPGRAFEVDVIWEERTERLSAVWVGDKAKLSFVAADPAMPQPGKQASLYTTSIVEGLDDYYRTDATWIGAGGECAKGGFLSCASGERRLFPTCEKPLVRAGSAGHCFALCSDEAPCEQGVCTPWNESRVCL